MELAELLFEELTKLKKNQLAAILMLEYRQWKFSKEEKKGNLKENCNHVLRWCMVLVGGLRHSRTLECL